MPCSDSQSYDDMLTSQRIAEMGERLDLATSIACYFGSRLYRTDFDAYRQLPFDVYSWLEQHRVEDAEAGRAWT